MPPIARIAGLLLIGASPAAVAAQALAPHEAAYGSAGTRVTTAGSSWQKEPHGLNYAATAPEFEPVVPAVLHDPLAPADSRTQSAGDRASPQPVEPPADDRPAVEIPLPLPSPGAASTPPTPSRTTKKSAATRFGRLPSLITTGGSLAVVLGLFFVLAWVIRHSMPGGTALLPKEAVEVLGRAPLAARQQVQLLRCGNKLILVSVTPTGATTLTEITEPKEVDRLAGLCRQVQPGSSTAAFRQVFQQFTRDHTAPELLEPNQHVEMPLSRTGILGTQAGALESNDV